MRTLLLLFASAATASWSWDSLPDFIASCNSIDYSALIGDHSHGSSGFAGSVDTNWNLAYDFPQPLTPLDSVKDSFPGSHPSMITGCATLIHRRLIFLHPKIR